MIEGTHILHDAKIRDLLDLKIFIHTDEEIRFKRRLERDVKERGRSVESVHQQYNAIVKPGHILFEIDGVTAELAKEAFTLAGHKLPIKFKIVENI